MFTITELLPDGTVRASIPWGRGPTLAHAVLDAANWIADETEGLIDHVDPNRVLALYVQAFGAKLVIAYTPQEVCDPIAAYLMP